MRTSRYYSLTPYNLMRDVTAWADVLNRTLSQNETSRYNYAQNGGSTGVSTARLPVDVWADDEGFHITAYVPGISPDQVDITFENDELTIRGELPATTPEGDNQQHVRNELFHGEFERRLTFHVPVDADKIEASFHNGVLELKVPKAEAIRPRQIKVQAQS